MILKQFNSDFIVDEVSSVIPQESGKHTIFQLKKEGIGTEEALHLLTEHYRIKRSRWSCAGNKDKHAVTTQTCSVLGRIDDATLGNISVKVLGFRDEAVFTGELKGNRFRIIVRETETEPRHLKRFVNYFDSQRFSSTNVDVGRCILRKEFRKACELLDRTEVKAHLEKYPTDLVNAIRAVPYRTLTLIINAYQSHLWNMAASSIIEESSHEMIDLGFARLAVPSQEIENRTIPLVSFDTEIDEIYRKILAAEDVRQSDFIIRSLMLTPQGSERELLADIEELEMIDIEDRTKEVRFFLKKGCYATMAIKQMFSVSIP